MQPSLDSGPDCQLFANECVPRRVEGKKAQRRPFGRRIAKNLCQSLAGIEEGRVTGPLLPVLLDARRPQAGEAMLVDPILPGKKFLDGERVAAAGLLERE